MPADDTTQVQPPAPVALVSLRNAQSGAIVSDVVLLVDTGADVTLLPRTAVDQPGISVSGTKQYEVMGFDGSRSFAAVAELDLLLLGKGFRGRYLLIGEERGILGRDVLNHLTLLSTVPPSNGRNILPGREDEGRP